MVNQTTNGYTIEGERLHLEEIVRKIAKYANTFVVGFFDCCRIPVSAVIYFLNLF
jgi:hypothetical protein